MRKRRLFQAGATFCLALLLSTSPPAFARPDRCLPGVPAYVFFLFDTSGSMNWSPPCTETQLANGECSFLCPTGDCHVPLQADDPASKFHQIKQALYEALSDHPLNFQLGFATFNQDQIWARAKHWLYEAAGPGVTIPGWGAFPAQGSREVFGFLWDCDTGGNDHEIGCIASKPADLSDAWELTRIQRLPKGGETFAQVVNVFVRHAGVTYRVRNTPRPGFQLGGPVESDIRVDRCTNPACSTVTPTGTATVSWTPVTDFLAWDNAGSNTSRSNPQQSYFTQTAAADVFAGNTCGGWDSNTDSASDNHLGYTLRRPTTTDSRGPLLSSGDVLPWDWQQSHRDDIRHRLAPNVANAPLAPPDFRIASYLADHPAPGETFLRHKNGALRPLITSGSTPHGATLNSFRSWYTGWKELAQQDDVLWPCRRKVVVVLTDGDETCAADSCATAEDLFLNQGVYTFVIAYGQTALDNSQLSCMASNGGTGSAFYPQTRGELYDTLKDVLDTAHSLPNVIVVP